MLEPRSDAEEPPDPPLDDRFRVVRHRVGAADVVALESGTARLRALDYRHGGGCCVDEAVAGLPAALALLELPVADRIAGPLRTAVADLHNLAGWACFDTGRTGAALRHFQTASTVASAGGDQALVSNIHYRLGRIHLHHDAPGSALAEFEAAERAARSGESALARAVVGANQAWARAMMGSAHDAVALMAEAGDHRARAQDEPVPGWAAFFTDVDLSAIGGMVHAELALTGDPGWADAAVSLLTEAVDGFEADMARSRTFSLIQLAVCHLLDGQLDSGTRLGEDAVGQCQALTSARTTVRLRPLQDAARRQVAHQGARGLVERIHRFRPADAAAGNPSDR
jgi:hypothetical protein